MKQTTRQLAMVLAGLTVFCSARLGLADDLMPPCWRGRAGTTFQLWNFSNSATPATPEQASNGNGTPQATIGLGQGAGGWISTLSFFGTNQGIWDLGKQGTINVAVPNQGGPSGCWKFISVQVTQYRDGLYNAMATISMPGATRVSGQVQTNVTITRPNGSKAYWVVDQSMWLLEPCPITETITITAGVNSSAIDQVVVDTLCSSGDSGDVFQPCWRGQSGTTFEDWSFHTGANPVAPEQKNSPGSPIATITVGAFGLGWQNQLTGFGCRQGYWDLGRNGTIALNVPNLGGSATSYKYVRVQVAQYQDQSAYVQLASVSIAGATQVGSSVQQTLETTPVGGTWVVDQSVWKIAPSPNTETIVVTAPTSGALVDQVVVDTLALDFACPGNITGSTDPGQCSKADVTWTMPAVDGCVVTAVTCTPTSGSTFPKGVTPVHSVITDGQGGTKTCDFTVTITDNETPVADCPGDMLVANVPALCGATVNFTATASDNCTGATVACVPPSGSLFPLGLTTVTCTATDASGNHSAPCTFNVRVADFSGDVSPPCWRNQPNTTFQQWAFTTGSTTPAPELKNNPGTPQATINLGPFALGWQDQLVGFGCKQGYWDLGEGGTISLDIPNSAGSPTSFKYIRVQVTQYQDQLAYTELASVSVSAPPGAAQVGSSQQQVLETTPFGGTWLVNESVWMVAPCPASETITITAGTSGALVDQVVVDTVALDPTCPQNIAVNAAPGQCGASVTWSAPAADGCIITNVTSTPASGSTFPVGITPVTTLIKDSLGGTKTCSFTITVLDNQPPIITSVAATEVQPYAGTVNVNNCAKTAVQGTVSIAVVASDNCSFATGVPTVGLTNGLSGQATTFVNQSPAGTFNYTWAVTPATANGTWTATVTAADTANITTASFTVCVDNSQITGQVQLQGFVGGGTVPPYTRTVTFIATDAPGAGANVLKTWVSPLSNSAAGAVFNYTLTQVPPNTAGLSAKTTWNLRKKLGVTLASGQATVNFTSSNLLLGGDIAGNDNKINAADASALNNNFGQPMPGAASADINGDGKVNAADATFINNNYGAVGDPQ